MQASIHGHKVLNFIKDQTEPVSQEQLVTRLSDHFGQTAQFHTCSAQELSIDQLLQLFIAKGKLSQEGDPIRYLGCQCHH